MGLLFSEGNENIRQKMEISSLHKLQCQACRLNKEQGGDMAPTGAINPLVYVLGEAPGRQEVEEQKQFVGESGELLRALLPPELIPKIRWNNCVRSRPPKNRTPEWDEIECFPGDTRVRALGTVLRIYRRWYEGKLIKITTASGRILSGSPQHPIHTSKGVAPLQLLKQGDYVVGASRENRLTPGYPNKHDKPPSIGQIFRALEMTGDVERVVGKPHNFHGDGGNSHVDIVNIDGLFQYGIETTVLEQLCNLASAASDPYLATLMVSGALTKHLLSEAVPSRPPVSCGSGLFGLGCIPKLVNLTHRAKSDLVLLKNAGNDRRGYAQLPGQFFDTDPAQVALDKVTLVEVCDFSGHLFNLETSTGQYTANGVKVNNCCRPSVVADIERTKPKFIFGFGGVPLEWVSGFTGIKLWRGRRMPVLVGNHPCWYFAFYHPAYLLREERERRRDESDEFSSEDERMTFLDVQRALRQMHMLPPPDPHTVERAKANVEPVTKIREIEQALRWASQQSDIGLDYETPCLRPYEKGARILSAGVGTLERAYSFPMHWSGYNEQEQADVASLWQRFLLHAPCVKAVHNLAFEMEWSAFFFGQEVVRARRWEDTANAAAILDERRGKHKPGPFSLEFLVQQYFGLNLKKISQMNTKNLSQHATIDQILIYNGMDAKYHCGLWQELEPRLHGGGLWLPYTLARRSVSALTLAQLRGLLVDQKAAKTLEAKYREVVRTAERKIMGFDEVKQFEQEQGEFNPYSQPNQLYVFDKILRRPEVNVIDKYSKEEKKSVNEEVLSKIDHPLAQAILDLRDAAHNKSNFVDPLIEGGENSVIYVDGMVHTSFNTFFAETGRLSAEGPNVQQWPKRDAGHREARKPFVAPRGCRILAFDYGQIEARVIAMYTKDPKFCKALWERYDIHQDWAEKIAYAYPDRVGGKKNLKDKKAMKEFRTDIKNQWTFPLVYGAKMESAAGYLGIPTRVIGPLFDKFWEEFEGIRDWQKRNVAFYRKHGYVECLTGRRRRGPMTLNQLMNSPIQGTAAEIIKDAMCRLSEKQDPLLQFELQIHDDLTFMRIPNDRVDEAADKIITEMLTLPFPWVNVPISVEMSLGKNWCDMSDGGTYSSDTWNK